MSVATEVLVLFASLITLSVSSRVVVGSATKISRVTRIGDLVVGFVLLSIATNLPEIAVAFSALTSNNVQLTLGNILGSNITNISLIVGLAAILAPTTITIRKKELGTLSLILFLTSFITLLLLWFGILSKIFGLILVLVFVYFCWYSVRKEITTGKIKDGKLIANLSRLVLLMCAGIFFVIVSARFVVNSSLRIAEDLGIDTSVIGATIVAIGTSLPELSITLEAVKKRHVNLALGDLVGGCLTKLTFLLGSVLLFSTFAVETTVYSTLVLFSLTATILLWHFISDGKLQLKEGLILLLVYLIFLLTTFGVEISLA